MHKNIDILKAYEKGLISDSDLSASQKRKAAEAVVDAAIFCEEMFPQKGSSICAKNRQDWIRKIIDKPELTPSLFNKDVLD